MKSPGTSAEIRFGRCGMRLHKIYGVWQVDS
jgi:hypothetical protein